MSGRRVSRRALLAGAAVGLPAPILAACGRAAPGAAIEGGPIAPSRKVARVGFAITEGFTLIDMAGPWEVFDGVRVGDDGPFELGTIAPSRDTVEGSGGMKMVPRWTFADAPPLDVLVVGAQRGGPPLHAFLRERAPSTGIVMSVCTGAFQLARAGLLSGKSATTHHDYYDKLASQFPDVKVVRGQRFVDEGAICSAGGLTSGIDLALHVVERLHGAEVAKQTAFYLEFVPTARPN